MRAVKDSEGRTIDLTEFIGSDELDAASVVSETEDASSPDDVEADDVEPADGADEAPVAAAGSAASAASAD